MGDRALQDGIIRYLADAKERARGAVEVPITAAEAEKAGQFARFLARRYYRDRLARSFRYSHRLGGRTGRLAEEIADGEAFDDFLGECVVGSLESARRVVEMAWVHLIAAEHPGPWWPDLLEYECAYFLQAAISERQSASDRPARCLSAICRHFDWNLPEVLPRLRAGEQFGVELRREVALLFSRTHAGRIYVVELEAEAERIFLAIDGQRTLTDIADNAGTTVIQAQELLGSLANIGAIHLPE